MEELSIITHYKKLKTSNRSYSMTKLNEKYRSLEGRIRNDSIDNVAKTFLLSENRFKYFQKGLIYSKILKNGSMKNLYDSIIKNKLKYNNNVISKKNENVKFRNIKNYYYKYNNLNNNKNKFIQNLSSINISKINQNKPLFYNYFENKKSIDDFLKFSPLKKYNNFKKSFIYTGISDYQIRLNKSKKIFKNKINLNIYPQKQKITQKKLFNFE
jgi:hypothetical protein